jgi:hypothetical protein
LKGKIQIIGDLTAPLEPPEVWQYDLNNLDGEPDPQS